jgi:hypothetical protein
MSCEFFYFDLPPRIRMDKRLVGLT